MATDTRVWTAVASADLTHPLSADEAAEFERVAKSIIPEGLATAGEGYARVSITWTPTASMNLANLASGLLVGLTTTLGRVLPANLAMHADVGLWPDMDV